MPYNTSRATIDRWLLHLDAMHANTEVTFRTAFPHVLAYRLREAVAAAKHHGTHHADISYVFDAGERTLRIYHKEHAPDKKPPQLVYGDNTFTEPVNEFEVAEIINSSPVTKTLDFLVFIGDFPALRAWLPEEFTKVTHNHPRLTLERQ